MHDCEWMIVSALKTCVPICTGALLDYGQQLGQQSNPKSVLGYAVVFALASAYFALATVLVKNIRKVQ